MLPKEIMLNAENKKVAELDKAILPWEAKAMDEEGRIIDTAAYKMWQVLTKIRNRSACIADELSQEIAEERRVQK